MTDTEKISASTLARIESANRIKKQESMEEYAGKSLSTKEADELWKKIQADKKKDASIMKAEKQRRIRAKNKAKPMGKATGGHVKSSAETSVIKGAKAKGSAQGSTIPGAPAKGSAEGSTIKMTPMKMNDGGKVKGKGSMLSITIEQKPINKKAMDMIKQAKKAGNVVKMRSGGLAKRGYGKARQ